MTKKFNLEDYKQPDFWADSIDLIIEINEDYTLVENRTNYRKNESTEGFDLLLNGRDLELINLSINEKPISTQVNEDGEILLTDLDSEFYLTSVVKIHPFKNLSGEGLYKSGNILCTQCEAEGFRRITFHQDRPDVMSEYTTKIIADKKKYPLLLSNGDLVETGDLTDGRHFCVWRDPHRKPSYLFALVAGDLEQVKDVYTTASGREVSLEFYVDHGNGDQVAHAMTSLKNSMRWDEKRFGLEYDLDTYMVVAVDSFNMGAMENKGLNIFNSAYVLAKPETATDENFLGIESVIGHEYFHNWTGNRVTCRDWFQLTLKEGLTVFRDQEFSADMNSRAVRRIDDVQRLKAHQFPEDAGPLSHPIKPKSYLEISNFYTSTIYEKGAEVIRMIHTLIGENAFRKGLDLYFDRYDGQAVTTEDFVSSMADASGMDLELFRGWYDQNGTPNLVITTNFSEGRYHVLLTHETSFNNQNSSLFFPFHFSLYNHQGEKVYEDKEFVISQNPQSFVLELDEEPIASWNEGFCAPVKYCVTYSFSELALLMSCCEDTYNQYEFAKLAINKQVEELVDQSKAGDELKCHDDFLAAFGKLLNDQSKDLHLLAYALSIPSVREFNDEREFFDFEHVPKAIKFLKENLAIRFKDELFSRVESLHEVTDYKLDPTSVGARALKYKCLEILSGCDEAFDLIFRIFDSATNMSDEISTLNLLARRENKYRKNALEKFYNKWKAHTLVMQKWLTVQARAEDCNFETLHVLEKIDIYDEKVPNLLRSLYGVFVGQNFLNLHAGIENSYQIICEKIAHIDSYNPQIAARLAKHLSVIKKLDPARAKRLKEALSSLAEREDLSKDTLEIVTSSLAG